MVREYVVFCLDELEDWESLGWFLHEADHLLLSLAEGVHQGDTTVAEAFDELEPHLDDPQAENEAWTA